MSASFLSVAAQLTFLALFLFTEWVDLRPWNNAAGQTAREHAIATVATAVPVFLSVSAFAWGPTWARAIGLVYWGLLLLAELLNWWVPYLFGVYLWEINPETYVKWGFDRTFKFLPRFRGHPVIVDAQHFVQILLTIGVVATCAWGLRG